MLAVKPGLLKSRPLPEVTVEGYLTARVWRHLEVPGTVKVDCVDEHQLRDARLLERGCV